jgi:hypothetical protein
LILKYRILSITWFAGALMSVSSTASRGVLIAALALAASPAFAQRGVRGEDGSAYGWHSDYAAAKAEAK